jgi:hypothetical protein
LAHISHVVSIFCDFRAGAPGEKLWETFVAFSKTRATMSEKRLATTRFVQESILKFILPGIVLDEENAAKFCSLLSPFLHRRPTNPLVDGHALQALGDQEPNFSIAYQTAWLLRDVRFIDRINDNSFKFEPKPADFGNMDDDENELKFIKSWLKWHDEIVDRPYKEGEITFEEIFDLIEQLKPRPVKRKLLFKTWALCVDDNNTYIVVDSAFLESMQCNKVVLKDILEKRKVPKDYWIRTPTPEHLEYLRNTYGGRKLPSHCCMLDTRALTALQQVGHRLAPDVREFLELLNDK